MENLNIKEINKKMALYIGGKYDESNNRWLFGSMYEPCNKNAPDFDKCWNWLNKIINKIEADDYMFIKIGLQTKIICIHETVKEDIENIVAICENNGQNCKTNIESTYKTCNDFIEWYNNLNNLNNDTKLYTQNEVNDLLSMQRGNSYVAMLTKTKDKNLAAIASGAPEPMGGKWRK